MDKIRITKDENGAVILRFEKREDCEKYTVYFRRENGRFKFLITTEKTAVRVNAVEVLGLEYRGKAAFIFACFQRQTVLYFEQRPPTPCSSNPRIPCGLCRRLYFCCKKHSRAFQKSPGVFAFN